MSQRLFFALWPDEAVRRELVHAMQGALPRGVGRPVGKENLHITLAFLGDVPSARRVGAERAAGRLVASSFAFELVVLGHWPRPRVVWSAPRDTPAALSELALRLNEGLRGEGFSLDSRPFHPHLTLARKVPRIALPPRHPPVSWRVTDFALVSSQTLPEGARYQVLRRWYLAPIR